jgi:hypothetical protein
LIRRRRRRSGSTSWVPRAGKHDESSALLSDLLLSSNVRRAVASRPAWANIVPR